MLAPSSERSEPIVGFSAFEVSETLSVCNASPLLAFD